MVVALNANALITEVELELMTGKTFDTDYANTLINFASDFIEKYCNRILKQATYTSEVYDGTGFNVLYVKNPPINSVTSIKMWDTYNNVSMYTYTEHVEYMIYTNEGYIFMRGCWSKGERNYQITYSGGYTTIPYDLKKACSDLCAWWEFNKGGSGIKSETIGTYSYSIGSIGEITIGGLAIPPEILSILGNYRKINI